jgi:hypothetical protein
MDKFKQTKAQVNDAVNTVKKQTDEFRKNIELEAKAIESATNPLGTAKKAADAGMTAQSPLAGAPAQPAPAAIPSSVNAPAEAPSVAPQPEAVQPDSGKAP